MRVGLVQARSIPGDVGGNCERHERMVEQAAAAGAQMIVFPELSLTGYEPAQARALAVHEDDPRLDRFQAIADVRQVAIAVGAPTTCDTGTRISLVLFQPGEPRQVYSKMHLHADEEAYFVPGVRPVGILGGSARIALAICYEIAVPEHAAGAAERGARVYLASVAKFAGGIEAALERLAAIAREHSLTVLMCNCVGRADGQACAGRTAAWSSSGALIGQLDDAREGVLVVDTATGQLHEATRTAAGDVQG